MTPRSRRSLLLSGMALFATSLLATLAAKDTPTTKHTPADSLQQKIDHLRENGARPTPDPRPTVFTDAEVDSYMTSGRLKIPAGISDIHLKTTPGVATATGRVDFDELVKEQRTANPLWGLFFTGVHEVRGVVAAEGRDGTATLHVREIDFDGYQVPRVALEFFLEHFLKPKVPAAGLDTSFKMPAHIDSATIGEGRTTLIQK